MNMTIWEHRIESWENDLSSQNDAALLRHEQVTKLDIIGAAGWELVTFDAYVAASKEHIWTIWKRPKPDA